MNHEIPSVSETDDTELIFHAASESGANSVDTGILFFGNFQRHANNRADT